ncbi:uncharacterized protein PV09_03440 [Verruconis gallopava]|uniref:WW domain-containing protein n=1 Tax=Verruconis gallopava TaxID=253628 RepID=A0A0D2AGB1_9PEZI|nr:uncharacterized protein PV09_03440 [Verruconis gallopava]KIW05565.1 hypothetical protein PV09_03440 [Verruconis gallopava]
MAAPNEQVPNEPPPSYEQSTGRTKIGTTGLRTVPEARNGITPAQRRSMEDENRPLPDGWIRQFDHQSNHQFFVDTRANPPRSIWHHPYDDEQYLASLSPEEREIVTHLHRSISLKDIAVESSDDEAGSSTKKHKHRTGEATVPSSSTAAGPSSAAQSEQPRGLHKYGRKLKDKITGSTHEERERERYLRAQEEQQAYEAHLAFRRAMSRAIQTGQPQFLAKDQQGHDIYIEPPNGPAIPPGARGYNPYASGVYANPNARFVRPSNPYNRPYGSGYGGGYGLPIVGGLLGGALLGGLLF